MLRGVPDQLRIWKNTPGERDPLARLDFHKKRSARVLRNNIKFA